MVIIGVVGKQGSGKTEFSLKCRELWGFEILKIRNYDYDLISQQENDNNYKSDTIQKLNNQMDFKDILKDYWNQNLVLYPITTLEQIKILSKRNFFHLIYIDSPLIQRFNNFKKKYDKQDLQLEQFIKIDDCLSFDYPLGDCIKESKFQITNKGDLQQFKNTIQNEINNIQKPFRPTWDFFFMKIANIVKTRTNCMKRKYVQKLKLQRVGCVIIRENRIIATGYNGTPGSLTNCFEGGCERCNSNESQGKNLDQCFCVHAEENAILEGGINNLKQSEIYCTTFPCTMCTKLIIAAKITKITYQDDYDDNKTIKYLQAAGIKVQKLKDHQFIF